jgi:predicted nucleic acid-binding protein
MIVAHTNLIAYLVIPGKRTAEAEAVLVRDSEWAAPVLWRSEVRSVIQKYIARSEVSVRVALAAMEEAARVLTGREVQVGSREVLELASRSGCSTYDCEFVAVASYLDVPLVTTDRAVLKAFPRRAMTPAAFLQ